MNAPYRLISDFLQHEPSQIFHDRLWAEVPWVKHPDRPRYECWMNSLALPYTYGSGAGERTYQPTPWHSIVEAIRITIGLEHDIHMDCCFLNGYKDGKDHLGWHADDSPEMDDDRPIVVFTVGAEREIYFRPKGQKGEATDKVSLPSGSLLIMGEGMQDQYEHKIPKASRQDCGSRISMTFRGLVR